MYHQSTIYIRNDLLSRLMEAVELLNVKRSRLIEALLIRYLDSNKAGERIFKMQKYQKIDREKVCERICVFWRYDVYERSCDVRKAFKMSVSFVIAEAIERYLDELIIDMLNCQREGKTYNYNVFYGIFTKYYSHAYLNAITWGDPGPKVLQKMQELFK